jgi:hypothetical protein
MAIAVGDVVTVTLQHSIYEGQQGEAVEIVNDGDPDGTINVKFGPWCSYLFDDMSRDSVTIRFLETELRRDVDWSFEVNIIRLFGREGLMWRSASRLVDPLNPQSECRINGCLERAARRCLINIWGTVHEVDLCVDCAEEFNGISCERLPNKRFVCVS